MRVGDSIGWYTPLPRGGVGWLTNEECMRGGRVLWDDWSCGRYRFGRGEEKTRGWTNGANHASGLRGCDDVRHEVECMMCVHLNRFDVLLVSWNCFDGGCWCWVIQPLPSFLLYSCQLSIGKFRFVDVLIEKAVCCFVVYVEVTLLGKRRKRTTRWWARAGRKLTWAVLRHVEYCVRVWELVFGNELCMKLKRVAVRLFLLSVCWKGEQSRYMYVSVIIDW